MRRHFLAMLVAGVACVCAVSAGAQTALPPSDVLLLSSSTGKVTVPGLAPRNQIADASHIVFGVATLVAGALTGFLTPERAGYDVHHALGWASAGLAAGTLLTGAWAHLGDLDVSSGLNPPNVHALLGITGGLLMIAAPISAPAGRGGEGGDDGGELHAALGAGGELLMGIAIVVPLVFRPSAAADSAP